MTALVAATAAPHASLAQDKLRAALDKPADSEISRYCGNVAPSAAEARVNFQMKRLNELEARVRDEVAELKRRESEARDWVIKREQLTKAATDDVVAIYAKMSAEAASSQLASMEELMAASILSKLKPQTASAILNEMETDKAAKLTTMMSGAETEDKKS